MGVSDTSAGNVSRDQVLTISEHLTLSQWRHRADNSHYGGIQYHCSDKCQGTGCWQSQGIWHRHSEGTELTNHIMGVFNISAVTVSRDRVLTISGHLTTSQWRHRADNSQYGGIQHLCSDSVKGLGVDNLRTFNTITVKAQGADNIMNMGVLNISAVTVSRDWVLTISGHLTPYQWRHRELIIWGYWTSLGCQRWGTGCWQSQDV